jgi:hypothetical protein
MSNAHVTDCTNQMQNHSLTTTVCADTSKHHMKLVLMNVAQLARLHLRTWDLACANRSRTRAGPTPTNISMKSEPLMERKGTPASPAVALASSVLPAGPAQVTRDAHAQPRVADVEGDVYTYEAKDASGLACKPSMRNVHNSCLVSASMH